MKKHQAFSKKQREILVGTLLGDAHAETRTNGKTYRVKIEHGISQKKYVDWLYSELKSLTASPPRIKKQIIREKSYKKCWFQTISSGSFRFYAAQFYQGKKKVVPKLIHRWLTPLALAVWFMDDGSIKSSKHSAKIINTQSFSIEDVNRLIKVLEQLYGVKAKPRKQRSGYQIYLLAETIERFKAVIAPHIIPSMQYKLG